jgi:Effector Associated Constant Component 1
MLVHDMGGRADVASGLFLVLSYAYFLRLFRPGASWRKLLSGLWPVRTKRSPFSCRGNFRPMLRLSGVVSRTPPAAAPEPGKRGDPITLGAVIIAAVSGGGALTALVSTIGSYLARDRRTEVEVATPDGRKLRISSQPFNHKELEELLRQSLAMRKD